MMRKETYVRQSSGSLAVVVDTRLLLLKYRLLQLAALVLGAATAIGLHFVFAN